MSYHHSHSFQPTDHSLPLAKLHPPLYRYFPTLTKYHEARRTPFDTFSPPATNDGQRSVAEPAIQQELLLMNGLSWSPASKAYKIRGDSCISDADEVNHLPTFMPSYVFLLAFCIIISAITTNLNFLDRSIITGEPGSIDKDCGSVRQLIGELTVLTDKLPEPSIGCAARQ